MHGLVSKLYKICWSNDYAGVDSQQFSIELRRRIPGSPDNLLDQIKSFLKLDDAQRLEILRCCGIPKPTRS